MLDYGCFISIVYRNLRLLSNRICVVDVKLLGVNYFLVVKFMKVFLIFQLRKSLSVSSGK